MSAKSILDMIRERQGMTPAQRAEADNGKELYEQSVQPQ